MRRDMDKRHQFGLNACQYAEKAFEILVESVDENFGKEAAFESAG